MYLYETHMHTSPVSACASSTPAQQVRSYKEKGYTGIIVTDHFSSSCPHHYPWDEKMRFFLSGYEDAKREGDLCGLDVFFGWEYSVRGSDFLTYGLTLDFLLAHNGMERMTVEKYSALIHKNGGFMAQAHPFRKDYWVESPYAVSPKLIDAIEVYNANMPDRVNKEAADFARKHKMPVQAGSDSHNIRWPFISGIKLHEKANDIGDIIKAIMEKNVSLILPEDMKNLA